MTKRFFCWAVAASLLWSCSGDQSKSKDSGTGDGGGGDGGAGGDGGDGGDGGNSGAIQAEVCGNITVQLYVEDEDGEREYVSWEDGTGGDWAFGAIWVGVYWDDEGRERHVGQDALLGPSTGANEYRIQVDTDETELRVYAVIDWNADRIIGSSEPTGVYPAAIEVSEGSSFCDADITILAPLPQEGEPAPCETVELAGPVSLSSTFDGGDAAVLLADTEGNGPYHAAWVPLQPDGGGASGEYSLDTCTSYGQMNLLGVWDENDNTLGDPMDQWGAYASSPGTDGNPVTIATSDLGGLEVQIPLGDGEYGLDLVPFVSISGELSVQGGTFDDLPSGSKAYVSVLKYRPRGEITVAELQDEAYDIVPFTWPELTGQTSVPYNLIAPANTIAYLWAYADSDVDGQLNESGDWVASGGEDDNGRFPTGTSSVSGVNMALFTADD